MTVAIIQREKLQKSEREKQEEIISKINKDIKSINLSVRKLQISYTQTHKKNPIPYTSFYHKMNNATFSEVELINVQNLVAVWKKNLSEIKIA